MSKSLRFHDAARCLGWLCSFVLLLAVLVLLTAPGEAADKQSKVNPTLEEALECKVPAIIDILWREMNHAPSSLHVGVIKFLVQHGDNRPSDNAGPLNWYMARRLEAALILKLPEDKADKIRILHIQDPNEELMGRINHLAEEDVGRKAFFQKKYSPAWGDVDKKISADVFLTGLVKIPKGARTMEVAVQAFDSRGKKPVEVCCFTVAAEPHLLTEAGVSYALSRGAPLKDNAEFVVVAADRPEFTSGATGGEPKEEKPSEKPKEHETVRKLLDKAPIELQIQYKNKGEDQFKNVNIEENGTVREPEEGTEVRFQLKRKKDTKNIYGVLLMVNGENTIYPEEQEPDLSRAHLWILDPKDDDKPSLLVTGFLQNDNDNEGKKDHDYEVAKFKVLSAAESRSTEVNYGPHAGTLTIVIFEGRKDGKDEAKSKETEFVRAISRGVPDKLDKVGRPINLQSLQKSLQEAAAQKPKSADVVSRGLIVEGEHTKQKVEDVPFRGRVLLSSIQLRYYKPQSRN